MGTVTKLPVMPARSDLPAPPYARNARANGWSPTFDPSVIISSDTWVLASDEERPWLLRIWLEAWLSVPVGSMPANRNVFARRIGCSLQFLNAHADILLRNWQECSDDRLYHPHITEMVLGVLKARGMEAERKAAWRESKKKQAQSEKCPRDKMGQNGTGGTGENLPNPGIGKSSSYEPVDQGPEPGKNGAKMEAATHDFEENQGHDPKCPVFKITGQDIHPCIAPTELSHHHPDDDRCVVLDEHPATDDEAFALTEPPLNGTPQKPKKPPCPYAKIRALWAEILPDAIQPLDVEHWTPARKAHIRARWEKDLPDLDTWEAMMRSCARSKFLMGKVPPPPGRKPFRLDLFWITKPENLLKLMEGRWHGK